MADGKPGRPKKLEGGVELKACPRCGEQNAHAEKDKHGLWRAFCPGCGWWDSMVYNTESEAVEGFNAAGGPNPIE